MTSKRKQTIAWQAEIFAENNFSSVSKKYKKGLYCAFFCNEAHRVVIRANQEIHVATSNQWPLVLLVSFFVLLSLPCIL